jgi:hypothetical protein
LWVLLAASSCETPPESTPSPSELVSVSVRAGVGGVLAFYTADSDGAYLDTVEADASGMALVEVPAGGFITAVRERKGGEVLLETVAAVEDGDELWFFDSGTEVPERVGQLSLTLAGPAAPGLSFEAMLPDQRTAAFGMWLPTVLEVPLTAASFTNGALDVLVERRSASSPEPAYAHALDLSTQGATPNQLAAATLSSWNNDPGTVRVVARNDGDAPLELSTEAVAVRCGGLVVGEQRSGRVPAGGSLELDLRVDDEFFDRVVAHVAHSGSAPGARVVQEVFVPETSLPAAGTTLRLDLGTSELPEVAARVDVDFFTGRARLHSPSLPNCGSRASNVLRLQLSGSTQGGQHRWRLIAPASDTVALPELDPKVEYSLWPAADFANRDWEHHLMALPDVGYAGVRNDPQHGRGADYWACKDSASQPVCSSARTSAD